MTAHPTLFDAPQAGLVRHSDPVTSLAAARSLPPGRTERRILDALTRYPRGVTGDQIADVLAPAHPPTVITAISRCRKAGLVVAVGEGESARKNRATIWALG